MSGGRRPAIRPLAPSRAKGGGLNVKAAEEDIQTLAQRVDRAREAVQALPEEARKRAMALKEAIEAFHACGLKALVRLLRSSGEGRELLYRAVDDPAVYALFLLHGIIRPDVYARVAAALEEVRPYLRSHGGDVELVKVEDGTVYVRLHGACSGCSLSALTLRQGVEETLKARVPEIRQVSMADEPLTSGYLPPSAMDEGGFEEKGWLKGPAADELAEGEPYRLVQDGHDVLLVRHNGKVMAFRNRCPHLGIPLERGTVDGTWLTCPGHGFRFDLTSGECLTVPHVQLEVFPVRVEGRHVWVRPS